MATTVTIAPTFGHALMWTQGGVGSSPGYDAIDLRRMIMGSTGGQAGVFGATDWKVTERTAGANMTVEIDANNDVALVQGTSITNQGRYVIAPHSAVASLDVAAAHATNPRIDCVYLQVRDNTVDASGSTDARLVYATGTATAGATLTNRNGAPTVPVSSLLLADVIVPAADTAIQNAQINDRRTWARGALYAAIGSGGGNFTTTSATLVNTNVFSAVIECTGVPLRIDLSCFMSATGTQIPIVALVMDGTEQARGQAAVSGVTALAEHVHVHRTVTPSVGQHTFDVRVAVGSSATLTFYNTGSTLPTFTLREDLQPSAKNG